MAAPPTAKRFINNVGDDALLWLTYYASKERQHWGQGAPPMAAQDMKAPYLQM
jgi:hypothetical protein